MFRVLIKLQIIIGGCSINYLVIDLGGIKEELVQKALDELVNAGYARPAFYNWFPTTLGAQVKYKDLTT